MNRAINRSLRYFCSSILDRPNIFKRTVKVFKMVPSLKNYEVSKIKDDSNFVTDLNLDSLDKVEIVVGLEEEFDITIEEDISDKFTTVKEAVDYIYKTIQKS
ncbi:acyl carrier protein [Bonamia ostreae]|uniref:Acyl carrier protein n=1 Tax=Bonamia ostreae TaxID=126728 RepID=A0ABV2AFG4_9EUKA